MRTLSRKRFTVCLGVCAAVSSVPGLVFAYGLNGWVSVGVFGAVAISSSLIAAQLTYRETSRKILLGLTPWVQCVRALIVAYGLFGLFMSLTIILMTGDMELEWALIHTLLKLGVLTATMGIILTVWLALPAVVMLAFWLNRSNKTLQATRPGALQKVL